MRLSEKLFFGNILQIAQVKLPEKYTLVHICTPEAASQTASANFIRGYEDQRLLFIGFVYTSHFFLAAGRAAMGVKPAAPPGQTPLIRDQLLARILAG